MFCFIKSSKDQTLESAALRLRREGGTGVGGMVWVEWWEKVTMKLEGEA